MSNLHQRKHPEYVDGCFGCKVGTLRIGYSGINGQDATVQKRWDAELELYRQARAEGIQPETTQTSGIRDAMEWSDKHGVAYSEEAYLENAVNHALEVVS